MASKALGLRISKDIYDRVTAFGRENYPKGNSFDISKTIHALLDRGLNASGVIQPVNTDVQQNIDEQLDRLLDERLDKVVSSLQAEIAELREEFLGK